MIRIEEKISDKNGVILRVEGRLDRESFPAFRQMCQRYLQTGQKVELDLTGLIHIGQDGLEYFRSIRDRVHFLGLNAYLKMAILDAETEDLAS
jgi:anti-anti-sigma regulatory factor